MCVCQIITKHKKVDSPSFNFKYAEMYRNKAQRRSRILLLPLVEVQDIASTKSAVKKKLHGNAELVKTSTQGKTRGRNTKLLTIYVVVGAK